MKNIKRIKEQYPMAYERWCSEADEELKLLYNEGKTIEELSERFRRQPSSIKSRLNKLGLIEGDFIKEVNEEGELIETWGEVSDNIEKQSCEPTANQRGQKLELTDIDFKKKERGNLTETWEMLSKKNEKKGYKPTEITEKQRDLINDLIRFLDRRDASTLIALLQFLNNRKEE